MTDNFQFWSCDLDKSADLGFFAQKGLISETVRARGKRMKFWDHQRKKMYLTENLNFFFEKVPVWTFLVETLSETVFFFMI